MSHFCGCLRPDCLACGPDAFATWPEYHNHAIREFLRYPTATDIDLILTGCGCLVCDNGYGPRPICPHCNHEFTREGYCDCITPMGDYDPGWRTRPVIHPYAID